MGSMARSIDDILEALAHPGAGGYQNVVDLAAEDPARLTDLVLEGASRLAKASTAIDASLALVPESRLADVADHSVEALRTGADRKRSQAAALIARLSLQAPLTLQDHLGSLWDIAPNEGSYYSTWPWRAARSGEAIEQLTATLLDPDPEVVRRGWRCLTESRTPLGWAAAIAAVGSRVADDQWSRGCFDLVGLEPTSNGYRKLFPERTMHVVFPEGFLRPPRWAGVEGRLDNPTWQPPGEDIATGSFGGSIDEPCRVCGKALHRLLSIEEHDAIEVPRNVVTCLSCVGWSEPILFFSHDGDDVRPAGWQVAQQQPQFPADPLPATPIRIVESPSRWQLQDWATSNGQENLNRVGGEPTWIQSPDYPPCPECQRRMTFAMQFDSLDIDGGPWWLWGSGGILYVVWCANCSVSATFWQCT